MQLRAIVRSSEKFVVKILTPSEWEIIRDAIDMDTKRICTSLLATGMRYAELQRFRENPDWLKKIHLPAKGVDAQGQDETEGTGNHAK